MAGRKHFDSNALVAFLSDFSFEDIAKSFFVLDTWLPNVASPIKLQYLYAALESIYDKLAVESHISCYDDFSRFCATIIALLPSFPSMEDFVPESDWGDIKYFFRGTYFKIFYGSDLENACDYYYAFETIHSGFDDYYLQSIGRSALADFEFCLSFQNNIIEGIERSFQPVREIKPGHIEVPPADFWTAATEFLGTFDAEQAFNRDLIREYTKDLGGDPPVDLPSPSDFATRVHEGASCPYFFVRSRGYLFPALPRQSFSTLLSKWGALLHELGDQIQQDVDTANATIGYELLKFIRERATADEVFGFCCAVAPDLHPHRFVFCTAFKSNDRIVLIHVLPVAHARSTYRESLNKVSEDLKAAKKVMSAKRTRLGLVGRGQMIEFEPPGDDGKALKPLIITVVPAATTLVRKPRDYPGRIIFLPELLGVFDELETLDELADFIQYQDEIDKSFGTPPSSLLDVFASFRDSAGVLIAGANTPDFVMLDPHWGTNYRYRTLSEFWSVFPEGSILDHPRSWAIAHNDSDGGLVLQSRKFRRYVYYRAVQSLSLYITAPLWSLTSEQVVFADFVMNVVRDGFALYHDAIKMLPLANVDAEIQLVLFPLALVLANEKFHYVRHLRPDRDTLWSMDVTNLTESVYGLRVVFDDERLSAILRDAKDRSTQVDLLLDILRKCAEALGGEGFATVEAKLNDEKAKPNRFRLFAVETRVSFPAVTSYADPAEADWKIAQKKLATIALESGVSRGAYTSREAKEKVNRLRDGLIGNLNAEVINYDLAQAVPLLISSIDSLVHDFERKTAAIKDSLDQEVDYERADAWGSDRHTFLGRHARYRFLVEKFVQLQPRGRSRLERGDLQRLLAHVDVLLSMYSASDHLHYGIVPATLSIDSDFMVEIIYSSDIRGMQEAYLREQAQINLGEIGNNDDRLSATIDMEAYLDDIDSAFRLDLGFGFKDFVNVQQVLAGWANCSADVSVQSHYMADLGQIKATCSAGIDGFDASSLELIVSFLTLDPAKMLLIENDPKPAPDLPVWEHNKRVTRYSLKPLIKIGDAFLWGPHSVDRSGRVWSLLAENNKLPADIPAASVKRVLEEAHVQLASELQTRIKEIVSRVTTELREEVYPSKLGLSASDIGDIDIFALIRAKNVLLNIESKIIDQAFCLKDLKRVSEKIFGRVSSDGSSVAGYLQSVEKRAMFLEGGGRRLAEQFWGKLPRDPTVLSIFVTQTSYWWTRYPPVETGVKFVELALLEQFLRSI